MIRHGLLAALVAFFTVSFADAQTTWRFSWQKGQTLTTKVEHVTAVTETFAGRSAEIKSKLSITKQWRVLDVDAQGTATVEQTLLSLRNEQVRPGGDVLLFDSADLEKSTPALKTMANFLNTPVAVIRVDAIGRVVEVKSGPKGKYDAEPPFGAVLPGQPVQPGQAWARPITLVLEPPLGAGEKYQAEQMVKLLKVEGTKAVMSVATTIKNPPDAAADKVPLIQKELSGEWVFDTQRGQMESLRLSVDKTVENHSGAGSSYRFACSYVEQVVGPAPIVPTSGTK